MNKRILITGFLIPVTIAVFAEASGSAIDIDSYRQQLSGIIENTDDQQEKHEKLIEAAELSQLTGDLNNAAELFKQASLAVKGKKDFESLYRASVLNVETAFLREAEADLRAIIMFSDDAGLRMKAGLLTARIKKLQDQEEEAKDLLTGILLAAQDIPPEAVRFSREFLTEDELKDILDKKGISGFSSAYEKIAPLPNPESVFNAVGDKNAVSSLRTEVTVDAAPDNSGEKDEAAAIQVGSFSVRENAEDLRKTVISAGWEADIKPKKVNGNEYFTVTVPVPEADEQQIQNLIIRLKEKGFEGYPVY